MKTRKHKPKLRRVTAWAIVNKNYRAIPWMSDTCTFLIYPFLQDALVAAAKRPHKDECVMRVTITPSNKRDLVKPNAGGQR